MGWGSGSEVARPIIQAIADNVADKKTRKKLYTEVIEALESADWDTQDEAMGIDPIADKILGGGGE